jgi:RNA polymerase sigma-70 factor (ECF subfamily)
MDRLNVKLLIVMKLAEEKKIIEESRTDKANFAPLYEEYVGDVYRYAYSIVNSKKKAEEITSEAFTRALEKINDFEWRGTTVKTWLFSITRFVAYESSREPKELPIVEDIDEMSIPDKSIYKDKNPQIDIDLSEDLKKALDRLPSITREIIILRIWEEYKYKEIAGIVDKSEDAVKKQFYRGVAKLQELLKQKGYDEDSVHLPIIFVGIENIGESNLYRLNEMSRGNLEQSLFDSSKTINNFSSTDIMKKLPNSVKYIAIGVIGTSLAFGLGYGMWNVFNPSDQSSQEIQ